MSTPTITVKPKVDSRICAGHVWVYKKDIEAVDGELEDGQAADVRDFEGRYLGRGLVSLESKLMLRLFARQPVPIDNRFFRRRLAEAIELRRHAGFPNPQTNAYRLVFSEADGVPGLVVDRFAGCLVLAAQTSGIEQRKEFIAGELAAQTKIKVVYERSDSSIRKREGLAPASGFLIGDGAVESVVLENGIRYQVNFAAGMKTGHFCDQRENRMVARRIAQGARALDVFSYTGGFALNLAAGGAASVMAVDQAEEALAALERNIALNGLDRSRFELRAGNAFSVLRELSSGEPNSFDVVVLDPPAFAKDRAGVEGALRGYKEINLRGLKLLKRGGYLLTCSCTHHVSRHAFREIVRRAARDVHLRVRLLGEYGHPPDHPVILNLPETDYLKALLLQVVEF
jgi:23S rRNA (cytosine1962-C5)-methyltransferase